MVHRAAFPRSSDAVCSDKWESFFPSCGKNLDIDFPGEWNVFSTHPARTAAGTPQFMWNLYVLRHSTFGIPIAKQDVTKQEFSASSTENMIQVIRKPESFKSSWAIQNACFVMRSVLLGELHGGDLLSCAGQIGDRLVAATRLFPWRPEPIYDVPSLDKKRTLSPRIPLPIPVLFRI